MNTKLATFLGALSASALCVLSSGPGATLEAKPLPPNIRVTQGVLLSVDPDGRPQLECPIKHTGVKAEITGFLARVTVTQEFHNTAADKVEAVYAFPLPHNAAVDNMSMLVGSRTVRGVIKRREEARAIYEAARNSGRVAGLLDQERPNIFTQSVANIMPGEKVRITISYVERLKYEAGTYEFAFPMVVGPRYIPGTPLGKAGGGWSYDTNVVPDASRITPHVAPPGTRAGHDISVEVTLDAGVPVDGLTVPSHDAAIEQPSASRAVVRLKDKTVLPNKDFILKYDVAGKKIQDTILVHRGKQGGFFTLFLQPPDRVAAEDLTPKELIFVLDTSGSMNGFPIEKAKETMRLALDGLNPGDTFNLITFAGDTHILFPAPVPATRENLDHAQRFLASRTGMGGTEMMKAVRAALAPSGRGGAIRVVCFMTDGYIGNENEILTAIRANSGARVFSFGIGSAVNRYLLGSMAEFGRGEVEYVGLKDDGSAAARRFYERVRNPLLTDISIEWGGLPVAEVFPERIPDLFSAKPLVLSGRYSSPAKGAIQLKGKLAGRPVTREIAVDFASSEPRHDVLAALWARTKVDHLMHQGERHLSENPSETTAEQITRLGLQFRLLTQYTSFVAVEEMPITEGGEPRTVQVPVELPEGMNHEGVFGSESEQAKAAPMVSTPAFVGGAFAHRRASQTAVMPPSKLHPSLDGANVHKLVRGGLVTVQVWVTATTSAVLAELKRAGLEVTGQPKSAKLVIGRVDPAKLAILSQLKIISYIAPL